MFFVDYLQAVEPAELARVEGITVTVAAEADSMGFPTVTVEGPTREAVLDYVRSEWGTSDNNRKAKFYELTKAGHKQVRKAAAEWEQATEILSRFLTPAEGA